MKKLIITAFVAVSAALVSNSQTVAPQKPVDKNVPVITFEKETHDFGVIPQSVPATYTFVVTNTGKSDLIIFNAAASCGCTTPEFTKEKIAPGKKGFIKATYNAASPGPFMKTVTVTSNASRDMVTLTLKGDVKGGAAPAATPAPAN
jgi:hypothetical protein